LATIVVLGIHWEDAADICEHRSKWRVWALINALRLAVHTSVIFLLSYGSQNWNQDSRHMILLSKISGYLEGFGLFWFLLGEHLCLLKNIFSFEKTSKILPSTYAR
jgi:hypothetical protein